MFSSSLVMLAIAAVAYAIPAPQILSSPITNVAYAVPTTIGTLSTLSTSGSFTVIMDATIAPSMPVTSTVSTTAFDSSQLAFGYPQTSFALHSYHGAHSTITITETVTLGGTCRGGPISSVVEPSTISTFITASIIGGTGSASIPITSTTEVVPNSTVSSVTSTGPVLVTTFIIPSVVPTSPSNASISTVVPSTTSI